MAFNAQKYEHIIWDFNGTILDDAWLCIEILNGLLARRKMKTITAMEYQQTFDFPVIDYYRSLGFDFEKESFDSVAKEYIAEYEKRKHHCKPQTGITEIIEKIHHSKIKQSVLSAAEQNSLENSLDSLNLTKYFEKIAGLDDYYAHSKIDIGKTLLDELNAKPCQTLLIGDTTHDFEVAEKIGIQCLLIPGGHQHKKRLLKCRAATCEQVTDIKF